MRFGNNREGSRKKLIVEVDAFIQPRRIMWKGECGEIRLTYRRQPVAYRTKEKCQPKAGISALRYCAVDTPDILDIRPLCIPFLSRVCLYLEHKYYCCDAHDFPGVTSLR